MSDQQILETFQSNSAPCTETLGMKVLSFTSEPPSIEVEFEACLLYTSPSPRDKRQSRMPSSA